MQKIQNRGRARKIVRMQMTQPDIVAKRITTTLEDDVYAYLEERAQNETRTVPNLLSHLGTEAMKNAIASGQYKPPPQPPPDPQTDTVIPPRELELTRKWVAGEKLEDEDLGTVANLLGAEPEDLVRKQHMFAPKKESANA